MIMGKSLNNNPIRIKRYYSMGGFLPTPKKQGRVNLGGEDRK